MKKFFALILISTFTFSSCLKKEELATAQNQKLVIWNLYDESDVFEGQIQAFRTSHPKVEIEYKMFSDPDFYEEVLLDQLAEGKGPDIFTIKNSWLENYKGKIEPLLIGGTDELLNTQIYQETFLPVVSDSLISEGEIWGISLFVDTLALYYNKTFLKDHFTSGKPGDTWTEFVSQVEQLTRENNSIEKFSLAGAALGRSDNLDRWIDILYLLLLQNGVEFFDEKLGKVTLSESVGRLETGELDLPGERALDFFTSFGKSSYKNYSWNEEITSRYSEKSEIYPFVTGKVAMIFGYSYLKENLDSVISQLRSRGKETIGKDEIGVIEVPQIQAFSENPKRDALASFFPLVVSKHSANPKIAWDFLIYLSSKESQLDYYEKTNKPSSRLDLIEEQKLEAFYGVFARQAAYAKEFPVPNLDESTYKNLFKEAVSQIILSKQTSQKALSEIQDKIQCLFNKEKSGELELNCFED